MLFIVTGASPFFGLTMKQVNVSGLDECIRTAEEESKSGALVYVLFCGSKLENGDSWCPDCVKAEPVVHSVLAEQSEGVFIHCSVGNRDSWKDPTNGFRTHPKLKLTAVPTLLAWGTPKRLIEEDCAKKDLVRLLFEED